MVPLTQPPRNDRHDDMDRAIRLREERRERWTQEGERSIWQNVSMIGAIGWLVVTPTLLATLAGRWLDGVFKTGITFTAALIFVGVAFGSWLAWQRIRRE